MLTRYFTAIGLMLAAVLIVRHLFGPRRRRALDDLVRLIAKVMVFSALLALAWKLFAPA